MQEPTEAHLPTQPRPTRPMPTWRGARRWLQSACHLSQLRLSNFKFLRGLRRGARSANVCAYVIVNIQQSGVSGRIWLETCWLTRQD